MEAITTASENIGKMVASLQSEMIESQAHQDVQSEQKVYTKVSHITIKEGNNFSKLADHRIFMPYFECFST